MKDVTNITFMKLGLYPAAFDGGGSFVLVGQAGKVVSGELGDLIQGLDLVLQLHLAAAGPGPSGSHNSWLADRGSVRKHLI